MTSMSTSSYLSDCSLYTWPSSASFSMSAIHISMTSTFIPFGPLILPISSFPPAYAVITGEVIDRERLTIMFKLSVTASSSPSGSWGALLEGTYTLPREWRGRAFFELTPLRFPIGGWFTFHPFWVIPPRMMWAYDSGSWRRLVASSGRTISESSKILSRCKGDNFVWFTLRLWSNIEGCSCFCWWCYSCCGWFYWSVEGGLSL